MKPRGAKLLAAFLPVLVLTASSALAGPTQLAISLTPKKSSSEQKREDSGNITQQQTLFQYTVKLTNRSFDAATGLSAQCRIFVRNDAGKGAPSQQQLTRQEFTAAIPDIPRSGTYSFDTQAVTLQKSTLDGGWHYTNGKRNKSEDRVAGVWIRILQGDRIVGEYINPSTLAAKEKF